MLYPLSSSTPFTSYPAWWQQLLDFLSLSSPSVGFFLFSECWIPYPARPPLLLIQPSGNGCWIFYPFPPQVLVIFVFRVLDPFSISIHLLLIQPRGSPVSYLGVGSSILFQLGGSIQTHIQVLALFQVSECWIP